MPIWNEKLNRPDCNATDRKLQEVCKAFRISGTYCGYEEVKMGNINKTYKVTFSQPDLPFDDPKQKKSYMIQSVNTYVFQHPVEVMENIDKVTEHIHQKKPNSQVLHFHHTADRKTYLFDENGFWRLCNYIPSNTYMTTDDLTIIKNAGEAFGEFQMLLSDFDASALYEIIPDFHNTQKRYEKLERDIAADPVDRVAEVREEVDWLMSVKEKACTLISMQEAGKLPIRVTHNDTKINNVLFDVNTNEALAVIDLDTIMPGLVGNDFGDAIRFASNFVEEDSREFDRAGVNMEVFRAFTEGFLKHTVHALTKEEIDTLALSSFVLATELAVRFLNDYLLGDPYFKIEYPEHNLVRARCQIALAKDMLKKLPEMEAVIRECAQNYKR